jgi:penicillin-binding protein 1A
MRTLLKVALFLAGTVVLVLVTAFCWLYFYSRDLPDMGALAQFAPATETQVSDPCLGKYIAVPYEAIGANLRKAISAVEVKEDDPSSLKAELRDGNELHRRTLSAAISFTMFCSPSKRLRRALAETRLAIQLERRYSHMQLFTMYANRVYVGPDLIGVQQGSEFYFHKNPSELNLSEAALLAGLMKGPSYYSPVKHSDRALRRRNEVLDAMVSNGSITKAEGEAAKVSP